MRKKQKLIVILLVLVMALTAGCALGEGTQKPDMLKMLKNSAIDLSPYAGKALFLNFFTEWCPYCMQEMPEIKKVFEDYSREELGIILVHVWDGEDETNSQNIRETYGLEDMTFFEDKDRSLATLMGLPGYPTSIFIDKDGYLAGAIPSAMSYEQMAEQVEGMGVAKAQPTAEPSLSGEQESAEAGIDFSSSALQVTLLMMLGGGLLAFVSPCVLPMLPVYALYLLGGNAENGDEKAGWGLVLRRCLGLAASFMLLFTLMGAGAGLLGRALKNADRGLLNVISGILMIVFGLGMLGVYQLAGLRLPARLAEKRPRLNGFWAAFAFGLLLVLSWAPCMTPLLANALVLAASAEQATMATGMLHLAVFALGLCLPMLAFMLLYQWLKGSLTWLKDHQSLLRRIGGGAMIVYGAYLLLMVIL